MSWEQNQGDWQLVIIDGPTAGTRVPVRGLVTIGRAPEMTVSMPQDGYLSGRHIRIEAAPAGLQLTDLGSTNGSYLNGQRFAEVIALAGDQLRVGGITLAIEGPISRQQGQPIFPQPPQQQSPQLPVPPQPSSPFFNAPEPAAQPAAPSPSFADRPAPVAAAPPQEFFSQPAAFGQPAPTPQPAWPAPSTSQPPAASPERSPWELIAPSLSQASQPPVERAPTTEERRPNPEPLRAQWTTPAPAVESPWAASSAAPPPAEPAPAASPWNAAPIDSANPWGAAQPASVPPAAAPAAPQPEPAAPFAWASQMPAWPQPEAPAAAADNDPWAGLAAPVPAAALPAANPAPAQIDPWAGLADPGPIPAAPQPLSAPQQASIPEPPAAPVRTGWSDSPWARRVPPATPADEAEATSTAPLEPEPASPSFESLLAATPEPEPQAPEPAPPAPVLPPATPAAEAALSILSALRTPLFALVDAAADPHIPEILERAGLQVPTQSLFEGERAVSLARWAPYLLDLREGNPASFPVLAELVRCGWGRGWASYFISNAPFADLRAQLRPSLTVRTAAGAEAYFRFYDPRVLRDYLPAAQPQESAAFFGPIEAWLLEGQEGARLYKLSTGPDGALNTRFASLLG